MNKIQRRLSLFLILVIICCMVAPTICTKASETTNKVLNLGRQTVEVLDGRESLFKFVPEKDGKYRIYSRSQCDVWACLYDANMNLLAHDDEGAGYPNFKIVSEFNAGECYYIEILASEFSTFSIDVIIEEQTLPNATAVAIGTTSVNIGDTGEMWYSFTPQTSGMYRFCSETKNTEDDPAIDIYLSRNIDEYVRRYNNTDASRNFDFQEPMAAGETYYLRGWMLEGTTFDLTIECAKGLPTIDESTETIEGEVRKRFWYTYTPTKSGKVHMYSESECDISMLIHENPLDGWVYGPNQDSTGDFDIMFVAEKGKTYYLCFYISERMLPTEIFTLTTEENAYVETQTGQTTFEQNVETEYYYVFTPEESGWYMILSESECDPAITIYDSVDRRHSIEGADDSDVGDNPMDFSFKCRLQAGKEYCLALYIYGEEGGNDRDSFELTIQKLTQEATSVSFLEGESIEKILDLWEPEQLAYEFLPVDCIPEDVMFTSNNEDVISFDDEGCMVLHNYGTATVTITTENNLTDTIVVTVKPRPILALGTMTNPTTGGYDDFCYQYTPQISGLYKITVSGEVDNGGDVYCDIYACTTEDIYARDDNWIDEGAGRVSLTLSVNLLAKNTYYFDIGSCGLSSDMKIVFEQCFNGWVKIDGGWYYYQNGNLVKNSWRKDSKGWCYLGADGRMATNKWIKDSKGWCYVGADGYCVTNCWKKDSKGWCYLGSDGRMVTNKWVRDSKGWCYIGSNGYAVTNCWKKDSKGWCYLDSNGSMTKNKWVKDGGKWYYLDGNGYMVTGRKKIGSKYYTFNSSGVWVK